MTNTIQFENLTLKELVDEYNKISRKNIKTFPSKEIAIEKLKELTTLYSNKPYKSKILEEELEPVLERVKKYYTPKQLEEELNLPAIIIRRKLRKKFPEMAKQGTWKITEEMIEALK